MPSRLSPSSPPPAFRFEANELSRKYAGPGSLFCLHRDLRLTTAKDGCSGQSACGVCLGEIDGRAALACSTPQEHGGRHENPDLGRPSQGGAPDPGHGFRQPGRDAVRFPFPRLSCRDQDFAGRQPLARPGRGRPGGAPASVPLHRAHPSDERRRCPARGRDAANRTPSRHRLVPAHVRRHQARPGAASLRGGSGRTGVSRRAARDAGIQRPSPARRR